MLFIPATTVVGVAGLIAALATLGLLGAAIAAGVIAYEQLGGLGQQLELQPPRL